MGSRHETRTNMVCDISIEYPVIAAFVKHAHPKCFTTLWMVDTKAMHLLPPPCASFMSFFLFFTSFLYLAVSEYISRCGCYVLLLVFLACFQMGFYFATTGSIFEIGLCENSINQSIFSPVRDTEDGAVTKAFLHSLLNQSISLRI